MTLEEILKHNSPRLLSNGQIRIKCPYRENHSDGALTGGGEMSMFLTPDGNMFHCFSCGAKGKLTSLLTAKFNLDYFEAIELVSLVNYKEVFKAEKGEYELDFILDLTPPKELLSKGIKAKALNHFKVGYNNKGDVCFPLFDHKKVLRGVYFRKYIDGRKSSEWFSKDFNKDGYLLNYSADYKQALLVEGPTDLLKVYGNGVEEVVSSLSATITKSQMDLMVKIPNWKLGFDTDIAGIKAMEKIYKEIKNDVDSIEFVEWRSSIDKDVKDPCDISSVREFYNCYNNSYSYAEFKLMTEI